MHFTRTGVVLCTENYRRCVSFYTEVLELPVMFSLDNHHSQLTCCNLGKENYLMIEKGGKAVQGRKSVDQNPTRLRFNVDDVEMIAKRISRKSVDVIVRKEVLENLTDLFRSRIP